MEQDDDPSVRSTMANVRPTLDAIVRSVLRANVAEALFGKQDTIVVGRYQLLRELGTGGGGSVFVARDPDLGREVALKLIVAEDAPLRERALAEGQALARLSHPNIVPVFDVGVVEDRVFLVMELIRGESLRTYASGASRRTIVTAYRQAADGLAAAHDAGLVHRDFKPDNAVIGKDGRVRVIDFGLALPASGDGPSTRAGTPRYMAPEQRAGNAVTAAADQYAFAVSLREAIGEPALGWLEPIVRRASSDEPAARYPSMAEVVHALADDPRRRWTRRALLTIPLAFAVVGFVAGRGGDSEQPCDGRTEMASTWNGTRAASVTAHLGELGTPFAQVSAPRVRDALDRYASDWIARYNTTCAAVRRAVPLAERAAACLARARSQLTGTVELLGTVTSDSLPSALTVISELPNLAWCQDEAALADNIAAPSAAQAEDVENASAALDRAQVAVLAAAPDAAARANEVAKRAREIGYKPLLARSLLVVGRAVIATGQRESAIAPLTEATQIALGIGDHATAVEAFARSAWATLMTSHDPTRAAQGFDLITALANQLGPRDRFARALLHNNAGVIENAAGRTDNARMHLTTALELARQLEGPGTIELGAARSNLALVTEDAAERARLLAERVELTRSRLGEDHPLTLNARMAAAFAISDDLAARDALRLVCESYARMHPTHGAVIVECATELTWLQLATGDSEGARASTALVLAVRGNDIDPLRVRLARGYLALVESKLDDAQRTFDALALEVAPEPATPWWAVKFAAEVELGRVLVARARRASPRTALERASAFLHRAARERSLPMLARRIGWVERVTD